MECRLRDKARFTFYVFNIIYGLTLKNRLKPNQSKIIPAFLSNLGKFLNLTLSENKV